MLDFGFSEILLTSAIALVVLGPERLPKVARQMGNWMGRARAMARQLSEQLEREVQADDLMKDKHRADANRIGGALDIAPAASTAPGPEPTWDHPPAAAQGPSSLVAEPPTAPLAAPGVKATIPPNG